MTTAVMTPQQGAMMEQVLIGGDLSKLSPADRVMYYKQVCESQGLNPLTKPFEYITLNGKLTLYAKRDCTDQLRKINGVSIIIKSREVVEGCYVVTAQATDAKGRHDESVGAVPIEGLKGEARSNALMKAETKAKRRVTLSVCGLGLLDETEVDSIPGAYPSPATPTAGYLTSLPAQRQTVMHETAALIKEHWESDRVQDGYSLIEDSGFSAEEMIALWSLLPSNIRSAHKRMKEQERATEKGVISPAQHKRLEAVIKESGFERESIKKVCRERWGVEHFTELTKDQYKDLDTAIADMVEARAKAAPQPSSVPPLSPAPAAGAAPSAKPASPQLNAIIAAIEDVRGQKGAAAVQQMIDKLEGEEKACAQSSLDWQIADLKRQGAAAASAKKPLGGVLDMQDDKI